MNKGMKWFAREVDRVSVLLWHLDTVHNSTILSPRISLPPPLFTTTSLGRRQSKTLVKVIYPSQRGPLGVVSPGPL